MPSFCQRGQDRGGRFPANFDRLMQHSAGAPLRYIVAAFSICPRISPSLWAAVWMLM